MSVEDNIEQFKKWVEVSNQIVFFGGAGVSTESGIPDFRSTDGLYNQEYKYPPETILSDTFFKQNTEEFFEFYRNKMIFPEALPSTTHKKLAELEKTEKIKFIITQNIDGLHQKAGSKKVIELHGCVSRNFCNQCFKYYGVGEILESKGVPQCNCGGIIKPDVVLYEEPLNDNVLERAIRAIETADMVIVGGTSLGVYPAAGLINYYKGKRLVLINKSETPFDKKANLLIRDSLENIFSKID